MPIGKIEVPASGPEGSPILLVGEAPGAKEEYALLPFAGESGDILINCLGRSGISREEIRLDNLCHYRPLPNNKFEHLLNSVELDADVSSLYNYIAKYKPVVIGALGAYPLQYLTGKQGISRYRGSILPYVNDPTIKVIPTYHPSFVLRNRSEYPIFDLDIRRIIEDSKFREFRYPEREYILNPTGLELEEWTQKLCAAEKLAVDIETVRDSKHILCVGFAPSSKLGVCIAATTTQALLAIQRILACPAKKILQFGTFDILQLEDNGFTINNYWWDTLTAQHSLNPELPRGLDFLTSIYTRQPYYKKEGRGSLPGDVKSWSSREVKEDVYEYNAKDCCCTFEIYEEQEKELAEDHYCRSTFDFEMSEFDMVKSISKTGMLRDNDRVKLLLTSLQKQLNRKQGELNALAGREVNVRSPALKELLYDQLRLPVKKNKEGRPTTDEDAIVSLITYCGDHIAKLRSVDAKLDWKIKETICKLILEIRGLRQLKSNYLDKEIHEDNRIRSTYKHAGPETGRWAAEKYVDGIGLNSQTFPRGGVSVIQADNTIQTIKIRSMIVAPKDHLLVQFDYSQAETWIVAHLANEPNMKKALMFGDIHTETAGSAIFFADTGCFHEWNKKTKKCNLCGAEVTTSMRYTGKRVNHASAYRMKPPRMAQVINKDSDQPPYVTVTLAETKRYSEGWHSYYDIKGWWREIEDQLNRNRTLITSYGRKRVFFAPWGDELFKEATAYEPQSTVADHANGRIHPELGIPGGFNEVHRQIVTKGYGKIINQSHDSIILELHKRDVDGLIPQIHNLLQRPLVVKGEQFVIPVDCEVGERWGELEKREVIHD